MKIKRYKKVNRHINFYVNNFGFRQPYQILIDGTFCYAALNNQVNIADNIPKYLQSELKLLTTQCTLIEMESLGSKLNGALLVLKQFNLHKCGHEGKPIPGSKCLLSMIGKKNEKHYIIATQDRDLQKKIRLIPGAPLLYLYTKTPVLDPPSDISVKTAARLMQNLLNPDKEKIVDMKVKSGLVADEIKHRKRKIKGPNPLSCKKKKTAVQGGVIETKEASVVGVEKTRGKKVRIPKHVKEVLLNNVNK